MIQTNMSKRKEIKVPEINYTNNRHEDSQQKMNNLNLGKTNSIKKTERCENKKREEYYWCRNNFQSNTAIKKNKKKTEKVKWPKNTTLIVRDSIINGVL